MPGEIGARWRARGSGKPPKLAPCSEQESPLQISPSLPTVHGAWLCLLAMTPGTGTRAHRHRLFLNGDHRDPLGEGQPQVCVSSQPPEELQPLGPSSPSSCPHRRPRREWDSLPGERQHTAGPPGSHASAGEAGAGSAMTKPTARPGPAGPWAACTSRSQRGSWMCQQGGPWQRPCEWRLRQKGEHFTCLRNTGRKAKWPRPRPGSGQGEARGSPSRPLHARRRFGFDPKSCRERV